MNNRRERRDRDRALPRKVRQRKAREHERLIVQGCVCAPDELLVRFMQRDANLPWRLVSVEHKDSCPLRPVEAEDEIHAEIV